MAYVGAASSLVHQGALRVPTGDWDRPDSTSALSLWPPGYPALIAVPVWMGAAPIPSARWINIVAAGVTAATIVTLVGSTVGTAAGVVAVFVVFATPAFFDVHLSVLSEPVFLTLIVLSLAAMVMARDRLLLLGLLATAAVMVRYAGAAVPAAVVTWTLLDSRYDFGRRFRRAAWVALLPAIAIITWVVRTALARDRHGTPEISVYGAWSRTLHQGLATMQDWLVPGIARGVLQSVIALIVAVVIMVFIIAAARETAGGRRRRNHQGSIAMLIGAAALLGVWYAAVLLMSRGFVGGTIPFDGRILAPLIILAEIAAVTAIGYWWRAYHRPVHVTMALLGGVWLIAAASVTVNDAVDAATEGSDFASSTWRKSPLVAWVRANGNGHPLYSNWPPALYFHAKRIARQLPDSSDSADVAAFRRRLQTNGGYVVGFDARSPDVIAPAQLAQRLSLHQVARTSDGAIWDARGDTVGSLAPVPAVQ